jgi:hypothetical protein
MRAASRTFSRRDAPRSFRALPTKDSHLTLTIINHGCCPSGSDGRLGYTGDCVSQEQHSPTLNSCRLGERRPLSLTCYLKTHRCLYPSTISTRKNLACHGENWIWAQKPSCLVSVSVSCCWTGLSDRTRDAERSWTQSLPDASSLEVDHALDALDLPRRRATAATTGRWLGMTSVVRGALDMYTDIGLRLSRKKLPVQLRAPHFAATTVHMPLRLCPDLIHVIRRPSSRDSCWNVGPPLRWTADVITQAVKARFGF